MAVYNSDYTAIINANGMDAYFYVRFLRMLARIFLPIWLLSWIVLLPVTSVGTQVPGHKGLDRFIFGNVENTKQDRYAAHLILTYFFTGKCVLLKLGGISIMSNQFGYTTTSGLKCSTSS
jgi:calcium permeable stress-gated cation channel